MKYYDSFKKALDRLKTRAVRGLRAALALIVALAIALTTCVGAWADESANDSALTQTVPAVPQTVGEETSEIAGEDSSSDAATEESEEDKAADTDTSNEAGDSNNVGDSNSADSANNANNATNSDSASSAPEASATPKAQADTKADEAVALAADDDTDYTALSWKAVSVNDWSSTYVQPLVITDSSGKYALLAETASNGAGLAVQDLSAENCGEGCNPLGLAQSHWTFEYNESNEALALKNIDTNRYVAYGNAEFSFTTDKSKAVPFNAWGGSESRLQVHITDNVDWNEFGYASWANEFRVYAENRTLLYHGVDPEDEPQPEVRDFSRKTQGIVNPKNTVINLFDYWMEERTTPTPGWNFGGPDNVDSGGINANHALKFVPRSSDNGLGAMNAYTGEKQPVRQGIVKNTLDGEGYPVLSGASSLIDSNNPDVQNAAGQSLKYLFDSSTFDASKESEKQAGKQAFMNTKGLLSEDADGYYYYDSSKNYAYYNEENKEFELYNSYVVCKADDTIGEGKEKRPAGQFFPFDDLDKSKKEIEDASNAEGGKDYCQSGAINHFFGMNLVSSFTQRYGGHVKSDREQATTFEFSGDDDVWIFIDNVLVADLGGIHQAAGVTIDFSTGKIKITNPGGEEWTTTLKSQFPATMQSDDKLWNGDTFADGSEHTFSFFYLERGSGQSNLKIRYNFREIPIYSLNKVDQYGNPVTGARFAAYRGKQETRKVTDAGGNDRETKWSCYYTKETSYQECQEFPKGATVNEDTGAIMVNNVVWADPILKSETNDEGTLYFKNKYGYDYEVGEFLQANSGRQTFLMREIKVPDGYRTVSEDFVLTFAGHVVKKDNGESDYGNLVLVSDDPYGTGVWASLGGTVTASAKLTRVPDSTVSSTKDNGIDYYNPEDGSHTGTLFAVVQHRHLNASWESLTDVSGWKAVYGTESKGYQEADNMSKAGSIEAAQWQYELSKGKNIFYLDGNVMKATFENLPGDPTQYYSFVEQEYFNRDSAEIQKVLDLCPSPPVDDKYDQTDRFVNCQRAKDEGYTETQLKALDNVRYVVTYYHTSKKIVVKDDWADVKESNTHRVHSHSALDTLSSAGFNVVFGARIRVPNVENRLIFRNLTYDDVPVNTDGQDAAREYNGSYFALYSVDEAVLKDAAGNPTGQTRMFYWATDKEKNKVGIYLNADPKYDGQLSDIAYLVDTDSKSVNYGQQISETGTYSINQSGAANKTLGNVTVTIGDTTYTIQPTRNANGDRCVKETKPKGSDNDKYFIEGGMNYFSRLYEGNYVLRQITAPVRKVGQDGAPTQSNTEDANTYRYAINISETMVRVDSSAIYANAGGDTNGVLVGNGAGYLVKTLNQFASQGILDETLTWIAMFLRVNYAQNFTAFDGFANGTETGNAPWGSASRIDRVTVTDENGKEKTIGDFGISRSTTQKLEDAMVTYLLYDPSSATNRTLFDYVPNEVQSGADRSHYQFCSSEGVCTTMGDGEGNDSQNKDDKKMRLYTDEGWSMLNIYQDYSFGVNQKMGHDINSGYTSLLGNEITPLFSNSTFVVVYNSPSTTPQIVKVESGTENTTTVLLKDEQKTQLEKDGKDKTCINVLANHNREDSPYQVATPEEIADSANENALLTCLIGYETPVRGAEFRISKQESGKTMYWTTARTWSENDKDAEVFTSDEYGKVLENLALKAYDTSAPPQQIVYTIEEVYAPEGYMVAGGDSVEFSLYNWEGNEEGSHSHQAGGQGREPYSWRGRGP